jgi:VanZ family protein
MNRQQLEYAAILFFEYLFLLFAVQAVLISDTTRFAVVLVSMAILLLPVFVERKMVIVLPPPTKVAIAVALLLHIAGGINRYYWKFSPFYDKLAHGVSALALGLLLFSFFLILDSRELRIRPTRILLWTFVLCFVLGMAWEVGEYYIDLLVRSSYNNGLADSVIDLVSNTIGSILAVLIAAHYLKTLPAGKPPGSLLTPVR